MAKQKINTIIRRARESHGLSQRGLAKEMSVTNSYISLLESGNRVPSMEFLSLFARKFKLPVLMFFDESLPRAKNKEEAAIQKQLKDIFIYYDKYLHAKLKTQAKSNQT